MTEPRGHPLWMCGFRPFFLLGSAYGLLAVLVWGGFWAGWWSPLSGGDGVIAWHAREMLLGFVAASLAGFILTAVPEFTHTPAVRPAGLKRMVLLWGVARLGAWTGIPAAHAVFGLADIGLLLALLWHTGGPLLRDPRQRSLGFALVGLLTLTSAYYLALFREVDTLSWLRLIAGWYMILIVLAMSRISMRIVNRSLEEIGLPRDYLSRPPKRNLAIFCLLSHLTAEFASPVSPVTGWVSMAVGAAFFNLLSDWPSGRVLIRRWVFMLAAVYVLIAVGYTGMGLILLFDLPLHWIGGARHLTYIGGIGLSIHAVYLIAGRAHAGLAPDERPWVHLGVAMLILATGFRVLYVWRGQPLWLLLTAFAWVAAFTLFAFRYWRIFIRPREDGEWGC